MGNKGKKSDRWKTTSTKDVFRATEETGNPMFNHDSGERKSAIEELIARGYKAKDIENFATGKRKTVPRLPKKKGKK